MATPGFKLLISGVAFLLSFAQTSQRILEERREDSLSLSLPLSYIPLSGSSHRIQAWETQKIQYRSSSKYSRILILSLPIGTPPQTQRMILDTGSQLSWVQCQKKNQTSSFDPSLSSTFSFLPCNTTLCKPEMTDFTLPTDCSDERLCHYSYFYADGTLAEGNLVREKITLSPARAAPSLVLGCAAAARPADGILGMNLGRLSFASQAGVARFSYFVPATGANGVFHLGDNPELTGKLHYVKMLRFDKSAGSAEGSLPYLDRFAYTVGVEGLRIGANRLNISRSAFRPDGAGAGQTIIDSGTEYTYLTEPAYVQVKEAVGRLVGQRFRSIPGFIHAGGLDICYRADPTRIAQWVGEVALIFDGRVEMTVEKDRAWVPAGLGSVCFGIGNSQLLGVDSNIIGNIMQRGYWLEFDLQASRIGWGRAGGNISAESTDAPHKSGRL